MGMDLIQNLMRTFYSPLHPHDEHVKILAASIRNLSHLLHLLKLKVDIATNPFAILSDWVASGFSKPSPDFCYNNPKLQRIKYDYPNFAVHWNRCHVHQLTERGIQLFAEDWNKLIIEGES